MRQPGQDDSGLNRPHGAPPCGARSPRPRLSWGIASVMLGGALGAFWPGLAQAQPNATSPNPTPPNATSSSTAAPAAPPTVAADDYRLQVQVQQQGEKFVTQASYRLPLSLCQSWRFITDYDSARNIPGIVESRSTRLAPNKVRVERVMQDRILFFPIQMRTVLEYTELPQQGSNFVQVEGETKSYQGSWRLQADGDGTLFQYQAVSEPASILPMSVIRYFINNRLTSSFAAMARYGATRSDTRCND